MMAMFMADWEHICTGHYLEELNGILITINTPSPLDDTYFQVHFPFTLDAKKLYAQFKECGKALRDKTIHLLSKTINVPAIEATQCMAEMCLSNTQTCKVKTSDAVTKKHPPA